MQSPQKHRRNYTDPWPISSWLYHYPTHPKMPQTNLNFDKTEALINLTSCAISNFASKYCAPTNVAAPKAAVLTILSMIVGYADGWMDGCCGVRRRMGPNIFIGCGDSCASLWLMAESAPSDRRCVHIRAHSLVD